MILDEILLFSHFTVQYVLFFFYSWQKTSNLCKSKNDYKWLRKTIKTSIQIELRDKTNSKSVFNYKANKYIDHKPMAEIIYKRFKLNLYVKQFGSTNDETLLMKSSFNTSQFTLHTHLISSWEEVSALSLYTTLLCTSTETHRVNKYKQNHMLQ